ncbi:MAG: glycosyltransferase family 4 protein [Candidatus Firestonebacteria bacterium]|nr:glycosyltransferase family 4 protein [Candidatus Firestonebacteria bacterium]
MQENILNKGIMENKFKKLSICIISQQYGALNNKSGVGTYTNNIVDYLCKQGHYITVLCPDVTENTISDNNIRLINIPIAKYDFSHGKWISFAYNAAAPLEEICKKTRFDIIHFTDAREALFCNKTDIPFIGTQNDYYFARSSLNPLMFKKYYIDWIKRYAYYNLVKYLEAKSLKKLDHIITSSMHTKEVISYEYSISKNKIDVVYNGIIESNRVAKQVENKIDNKKLELLFVGANFQRKGLPQLLRALSIVIKKYPLATLNVIGENQNQKNMIDLCGSLGIESHVNFLGFLPNDKVLEYFSKSHIFVMPSIMEGFGIVFLESMARGVPVIASNTGGIPEAIIDGENGFLVDPFNHIEIAEKIIRIAQDNNLRQKFINEGYKRVKFFSIDKMVSDNMKIYYKILK